MSNENADSSNTDFLNVTLNTTSKVSSKAMTESSVEPNRKQPPISNPRIINNPGCPEPETVGKTIYTIFHIIMSILAVVLSIRCNGKNFSVAGFTVAVFFPYLYVIWVFATKNLRVECDI